MTLLPLLLVALFAGAMIAAAAIDVMSFTIPNRLTAALAVAFIPGALLVHLSPAILIGCVQTGAVALGVGLGLFTMGWCGGGDAKLIAACALWLGWQAIAPFILFTSLAGGVLALGMILARKAVPATAGGPAWLGRLLGGEKDLPYAVAIAAGALLAMPSAPIFAALRHAPL